MDWSDTLDRILAFFDIVLFKRRGAIGTEWTTGDLTLALLSLSAAFGASIVVRRLLGQPAPGSDAGAAPGPEGSSGFLRFVRWVIMLAGVMFAMAALHLYPHALFEFRLFRVSNVEVTMFSLVVAAGIVVAAMILSRVIQGMVRRSLPVDTPQAVANVRTLTRFIHYVIVLIGVAIALPTLGIDIGALLAVGGVFVLALGFAMKEITENFVSGVILLAERAIKPGDILEVEGLVVRVSGMGIRATMGTTRDGEELIIPNSTLVGSTVKNLTYADSLYRIHVTVGVSYDSDMKLVFSTLRACADSIEWRAGSKPCEVYLVHFGTSSVDFEVVIWIGDPWRMRRAGSDLRDAIWWALRNAGLVIAYPQMDLHLDERGVEALRGRIPPKTE